MSTVTVTSRSALFLVIGDPISHSLSPTLHNAAYTALGLPCVMAASHVRADSLADAIAGVRALSVRGLAVTMPHKVTLVELLDDLDPTAKAIGAVNTVVNSDGSLKGHNTDWLGIVTPLERVAPLKGKRVAILGAGGAAQAAVYGCASRGATVAIFNRTLDKARPLAELCGGEVFPLTDSAKLSSFDIVINTTSVGMGEHSSESPIPPEQIEPHHTVFETIYHPLSTQLVKDSERRGATIIRGLEMFLEQGLAQFELHTGVKGPREVMKSVLMSSLTP